VPKGTVEIKVGSDGKQWKISVDMLVARGHAEEFELGVEQEHVGIGGVRVKVGVFKISIPKLIFNYNFILLYFV
jgi:hypothetical protein